MIMKLTGIVLFVAGLAGPLRADVRLPKLFTDNMMLQRNRPIRVWGWAAPGETVRVALAGTSAAAKADLKGEWNVELPALQQGEALELVVSGQNEIVLKNIIVGDVWLCSGQSNMEIELRTAQDADQDIRRANLPKIRRLRFRHAYSGKQEQDIAAASWEVCSPQSASEFTGVGFYFARAITEQTGVPIGILDDNWGGTEIERWTSPDGMALVPELEPDRIALSNALAVYGTRLPLAIKGMEHWLGTARAALAAGTVPPPAPELPAHPALTGWCSIYNAMISPITRFPHQGRFVVPG